MNFAWRGGYIDEMTPQELADQVGAGLPFLPYTYANELDPGHTLARLAALEIPFGAHVVGDVEGVKPPAEATTPALVDQWVGDVLIPRIDLWGVTLSKQGFVPCGYFGAQELLTSEELTRLAVYRYHEGASRILDRRGNYAQPARGYAIKQGRPVNTSISFVPGKAFDVDFHCLDYEDDAFCVVRAA